MNNHTSKTCSKCGVTKPITEFTKHRKSKDGYSLTCLVCKRIRDKEYRESNKEKTKASKRNSYNKKIEHYREHWKNYAQQNKERIKDYQALYKQKHRLQLRKHQNSYRKLYYPANKMRYRAWATNRRARVRGASGDGYSPEDVQNQYKHQKGKCYWCKKKVGQNYHVDHVVPLAKGGDNDKWNIVISCPECNLSKQDKLPHEWTNRLC